MWAVAGAVLAVVAAVVPEPLPPGIVVTVTASPTADAPAVAGITRSDGVQVEAHPGTPVVLTAMPRLVSVFTQSGDVSDAVAECSITINGDTVDTYATTGAEQVASCQWVR